MKRREVAFPSEDPREMIRADLYTPDTGKGPWPVVVMGGGWCYVKDRTAAQRVAHDRRHRRR